MKTDIYLPDDFIIREGEVGNEMFFLMDGVAKIVIKNVEDPLKPPFNIYLKKGSYVGGKLFFVLSYYYYVFYLFFKKK